MITDYQILGIAEGSDLASVKRAFRRRAKELHPDLSSEENALSRHDLFTQVCGAYRRLSATLDQKPPVHGAAEVAIAAVSRASSQDAVAPHSHQDYVFYRQGMRFFMAIHPSQWNFDRRRGLDSSRTGDEEESEATKARVIELMKFFPKAYYYFSLVAHEYPESEWAFDARDKMAIIETRIGMYRKILASFDRNLDREAARAHLGRHEEMKKNQDAIRQDMPRDW